MLNKNWLWRSLSVALVVIMALSPVLAAPARVAAQAGTPNPRPSMAQPGVTVGPEVAQAKIHPALRKQAQALLAARPSKADVAPLFVEVIMRQAVDEGKEALPDFSAYFVGKTIVRPAIKMGDMNLVVMFGQADPRALEKMASKDAVWAILPVSFEKTGSPDNMPIDEPRVSVQKTAADWEALQKKAETLRLGSLPWKDAKAFGDGRDKVLPNDWFEAMPQGPHKAEAAWDRGYTGEGVTVAVNDDGVDFAHPDLMGTQKMMTDPASPYAGWPEVFSPISALLFAYDSMLGTTYIKNSYPGAHFVDTSYLPRIYPCDPAVPGTRCFIYRPLIDYGLSGTQHEYRMDAAMSVSGVIHVGTHPDRDLRDFIWGELPAVLVTDPNVAGQYDTVYIDLDDDYDFRDEKPLTKADIGNLDDTYNNMVSYRDMNGDGIADIGGGMLYFIADGSVCPPVTDWLWGCGVSFAPPANGDLIALEGPTWDRDYSHGTQCASNVAGQGVVNGLLPSFDDLPGDGVPAAAIRGMAPDAKIVAVADIYLNFDSSKIDAYLFNTSGYDGAFDTGDEQQITSNSYGSSDVDNDGWEYDGQFISQLNLAGLAPYTQFLGSTGNGGPGYGTTAPPSPVTGISVGASTEFGSTGWDSIGSTDQIMFNDVIPFSDRGPGANGNTGVDVVAGGAFAAGAEEMNYYVPLTWGELDGNLAWASWGGTSRSTPVAAGVLATLYQAYYDTNLVWPDFETAKALLKSSATDIDYDVLTMGAGSVNADAGTLVASGEFGTYTTPSEWNPGDFRGVEYEAFANVAYANQTYTKDFTVNNPSPYPMTVGISDGELLRVGQDTFDYTITPQMAANYAQGYNPLKAPPIIIPLTAKPHEMAANPWWNNVSIPAGTDLMIVRMNLPYAQMDPNEDLHSNNNFRLVVYNWKDVNNDHKVWNDANGNGFVDIAGDGTYNIDVLENLDFANSEIQESEYGRFGYGYPEGNQFEMWVQNPTERMLDGLFIGIANRAPLPGTNLHFQIDFYKNQDATWITTPTSVVVPAHGTATVTAEVNVPDWKPGVYEAAIRVQNPPVLGYQGYTSVVPVTMFVAEDFAGVNTLGGEASRSNDDLRPYNNGALRGAVDWGWRPETGDWRFFFMDINNQATTVHPLITEDFEAGVPPVGWTVTDDTASGMKWYNSSGSNLTGGGGKLARANGYLVPASGMLDTSLVTPSFDLNIPGDNGAFLTYNVYYNNYANLDYLDLDISLDNGVTWNNLKRWNEDHGTTYLGINTGEVVKVDLSEYLGMEDLKLRWRYYDPTSADADNWYAMVDKVRLVSGVYPFPESASVLTRNVWDSAAPHTDIDTIILGPKSTPVDLPFGTLLSPFFGPYTLDTVARSANTNVSAGRWAFNTTSGGNEEWVAFGLNDGLHEIINHEVMWEGDKMLVPFTTTVGMMSFDKHFFNIKTYVDQGVVGELNLESTIDLNGIVTDAFLIDQDKYSLADEPMDAVGWEETFDLQGAYALDIHTTSSDISDTDLYLYYCYDADCNDTEQMASSAGGTADEAVSLNNPPDGKYLVVIENYSGTPGHFNYDRVVMSKVPGLHVETDATGPVSAGTPVNVEISYDYELEPGQTYDGLVFIGIPEATQLKAIPITIERLGNSAAVVKTVDKGVTGADEELTYTIKLYNKTDPFATFHFEDLIPANTSFVSVSSVPAGVTYNPVSDKITYDGALPLSVMAPQPESFENQGVLPGGWSKNASGSWTPLYGPATAHTGDYAMFQKWDPQNQDSRLFSPWFDVTPLANTVSFWVNTSTNWPAANLRLYVVDQQGYGYVYWNMVDEESWPTNIWRNVSVDLSDFEGEHVRLMWRYTGQNGDEVYLDDVLLPGATAWTPSMTVTLKVKVDTGVTTGTITNEATLDAQHVMPQETQDEPQQSDGVQTTVGTVDLSTSYKTAPEGMWTGGVVEYELHLINTGTAPAIDVAIDDPLPAGVTYLSHFVGNGPSQFIYDDGANKMLWTGTINPGQEIVLKYAVKINNPTALTEIENSALMTWYSWSTNLDALTLIQSNFIFLPVVKK